MIRFETPSGKPFDLDYTGPIHCRNDLNNLIAFCPGAISVTEEDCKEMGFSGAAKNGDPYSWDHWELRMNVSEKQETILQRAIASAFSASALAARIVVGEE